MGRALPAANSHQQAFWHGGALVDCCRESVRAIYLGEVSLVSLPGKYNVILRMLKTSLITDLLRVLAPKNNINSL